MAIRRGEVTRLCDWAVAAVSLVLARTARHLVSLESRFSGGITAVLALVIGSVSGVGWQLLASSSLVRRLMFVSCVCLAGLIAIVVAGPQAGRGVTEAWYVLGLFAGAIVTTAVTRREGDEEESVSS